MTTDVEPILHEAEVVAQQLRLSLCHAWRLREKSHLRFTHSIHELLGEKGSEKLGLLLLTNALDYQSALTAEERKRCKQRKQS